MHVNIWSEDILGEIRWLILIGLHTEGLTSVRKVLKVNWLQSGIREYKLGLKYSNRFVLMPNFGAELSSLYLHSRSMLKKGAVTCRHPGWVTRLWYINRVERHQSADFHWGSTAIMWWRRRPDLSGRIQQVEYCPVPLKTHALNATTDWCGLVHRVNTRKLNSLRISTDLVSSHSFTCGQLFAFSQ